MFYRPKPLPQFIPRRPCPKEECARSPENATIDQRKKNFCTAMLPNSHSSAVKDITDLAKTLTRIMMLCDIHECKANASWELIADHFINCDIDAQVPDRKCLRKQQLYRDLRNKALVESCEIDFIYYIIKCGFTAYYYKPAMNLPRDPKQLPYNDICVWLYAAKKTSQKYALENQLVCEELKELSCKICNEYRQFYERMTERKQQARKLSECQCCYCAKKRVEKELAKVPACLKEKKKPCTKCCKKVPKQKLIKPKYIFPMCTRCNRLRNFCECKRKHHFKLNWVQSIWTRADFDKYYNDTIADPEFPPRGLECRNSLTGSLDRLKREERMARQLERSALEMEMEGTEEQSVIPADGSVNAEAGVEEGEEPKVEEAEPAEQAPVEEAPAEAAPAEG